ncbi:MAG TPA: cupin domain-containing protein [Polyangia bacterium]|nr:cupin domain-containing protein [Polyangia bacterium]
MEHLRRVVSEWFVRLQDIAFWSQSFASGQPFSMAGHAQAMIPLLGWDVLERVLGSPDPIDLMTVRQGQLIDCASPRARGDVEALFRRGVSTVVRAAERHDGGLAALASSFEAAAAGRAHVQLYATPGGTNSYGWHFDFEDVFIIQTAGTKDYYFRDNTVAGDVTLGAPMDFTAIRRETSPVYTARLIAGDWLYIPSRWWHLVKCVDDALSISTGVMPPRELVRARRVPQGWA